MGGNGSADSSAIAARLLGLHPMLIDLSLDRLRRLLADLHHPERRLPPVIHVAGTNGKGSTIAFMRAMLEAAGLRVHVYTSPHLVRFHERFRIGRLGEGRLVEEARLVEALRRAETVNAGRSITLFEMTTAVGFLLFSEEPADILLLEVGLGGRLDATNVIDDPAVAVITPVGQDHAEFLGTSLAGIAREKAGIMKSGCPVVIAPQDYAEADAELCRQAEAVGATPLLVGNQDFSVHAERGRLVYQDEERLMDLPLPRLAGAHQLVNAATAIAAIGAAGLGRFETAVFEAGMRQVAWPARLQRLSRGRLPALLPDGAELWLDGGHNADGGRVVSAAMADLEERASTPLVLVLGMLAGKDAAAYLASFRGLAREVVTVPIAASESGRSPTDLAAEAERAGLRARPAASIEDALRLAASQHRDRPPRVLIGGSLYLAGEALALNGTPPD